MAPRRLRHVGVIGVSSHVAPAVIGALSEAGFQVTGFSRSGETRAGITAVRYDDDSGTFSPHPGRLDALVNLAPLPLVASVLRMASLLGASRLIAFGSTGVFSKADSTSPMERQFVADQREAEEVLARESARLGIHWTLFRPTMIYGAGGDQNVTFIRNSIRRFHVFPLPLGRSGLRQPVHVADLALACTRVLENETTFDRAYNLGGGEVLPYSDMVRRIFRADGHSPKLLPIPAPLFRLLVKLASRLPGLAYLRPEMVDRMRDDLVADNTDAARDFGYSPRGFEPPPA
ncbi:MAG: NAD-dependent epimerase/dehydratase family protein [Pseudomonadales bacterium]|nr:NAD-dependent epimerase/dehydratase family protein [Pseudomonadales bacterium]